MTQSTRFSPEGLEALRLAARKNRPWEGSTGPRTAEGKARSRWNALKHGYWSRDEVETRRAVSRLLRLIAGRE